MSDRVWRIKALHSIIILIWIVLFGRLVYMQIICEPKYSKDACDNMVRKKLVPAARGLIYDRCGRIMARNVVNFVISITPSKMDDSQLIVEKLMRILRISDDRKRELLERISAYPQETQILKESLDDIMLAQVAELQGETDGIYIEAKSWREYPLGTIASHVLGYVGEIDSEELEKKRSEGYLSGEWIGKDGLEYSQNSLLHGKAEQIVTQVDVSGEEIRQIADIPGIPGSDIHLSLDAQLQREAELSLQDSLDMIYRKNGVRSGGAVVAIEANTGFVRVLASLPSYDPNWFSKGISFKRFNSLIKDPSYPLLNRAVGGAFPPGSTFKLVTTAAALQDKVIYPYSWFYCPGVFYVEDHPFNCFVRSGHGGIGLTECIAESCDVAYYSMGCKLGLPRMLFYAKAFGVGQSTGIELPGENEGNFPYPGWKEKVFKENWFPGDNANTAIGQGFVTTSPLQVAIYTAAIANGGTIYKPHLIESVESTDNFTKSIERVNSEIVRQVPVSSSYLAAIRAGMIETVRSGTASKYSRNIDMAGKTGTVENSPTSDNPYGRNHTWFTGFAPSKNPELVVTVFLEKSDGYGGEMAAPIAYDVVRLWNKIRAKNEYNLSLTSNNIIK